MLGKLFGIICLGLGLILGGWIGYNLFIEVQPEAEGRNPLLPIVLTIGLLYVGISRLKGDS
ncbi:MULTISPECIES: hypothetical protein [Corallincola]|uniref:Uncharacterized protein n=2 Tax=Corallincola TaxID=1775176 RepID=A0A368NRF2_9GAMM|nr:MULTISPECIES: hypothetical protein [Corallincola]RCU52405.1 hypothetical protein DU002_00055 [Corallincola holothuriorum]TAA48404.1 hypothetical protein EXY25_04040 [Corallincola spongiicola]